MVAKMFVAVALVALATVAHGSLMSLDLGGEFLKVAVVKAGRTPISIAINEMSRRKTPALVGFLEGDRVLGEAAVTMTGRHPDKVFGFLRDMLGKPANHPEVKKLIADNNLNYQIVEDPVRKTIRIKMPDTGVEYSIEEMVASVFTYAHQISKEYAGVDIRDTVLLVPPYFGPAQRQALLDAAELSGLNVLSLMHSYSAAALQYGIERDFENRTENVIVYDMGATGITAALVTFSAYPYKDAGKTKYLSQFLVRDVAWSEGNGSLRLDLLLKKHFAAEFTAKHSTVDVLTVPKSAAKMNKPVRQIKEMLSANVDAPFNVEELYEGKDFASSMTRTQFEELAGDYWESVKGPLEELLVRNALTADNFTVQLVGGGSRVPRAQLELSSLLEGIRLERNMDADEAVVLGGGLYAANKSTMFRLRKFGMSDGHVYPVSVTIDDFKAGGVPDVYQKFSEEEGGEPLISYMKALDVKRKLSMTDVTADPLKVSLHLSGDRLPRYMSSNKLVSYTIAGLNKVMDRYNQTGKVQLHFVGNSNGLVYLQKADATVEFIENVEVEKEVPDDDSTDTGADPPIEDAEDEEVESTKDGDVEDENVEGAKDKNESTSKQDTKESKKDDTKGKDKEDKDSSKEKDSKPKQKMKKIKVMKRMKRTRIVALNITEIIHHDMIPMSDEDKATSKKKLSDLRKKELAKQESAKAKNELESYIINMASKLEDNEDIIAVTTEEQRTKLKDDLVASEDWLYMDEAADDAPAKVYVEKLKELTKLGNPMEVRAYEMTRREERIKGANKLIDIIGMSTNTWVETKPWLNVTRIQALKTMADDFEAWLKERTAEQTTKAAHEDPAFKVDDLTSRMEVVHQAYKRLQNVKAPKPPPPPPAPPAPSKNDTDETIKSEKSAEASDNTTDSSDKQEEAHDELR